MNDLVTDTITGFAARLGVEYSDAQGLISFLKAKEIAKEVGEVKKPGARGKGAKLFELPVNFTININTVG